VAVFRGGNRRSCGPIGMAVAAVSGAISRRVALRAGSDWNSFHSGVRCSDVAAGSCGAGAIGGHDSSRRPAPVYFVSM